MRKTTDSERLPSTHPMTRRRKDGSLDYERDTTPSFSDSVAEMNRRIMQQLTEEVHALLNDNPTKRARLIELLKILRSETAPIAGHSDPGAITDCWNEVFEMLEEADE